MQVWGYRGQIKEELASHARGAECFPVGSGKSSEAVHRELYDQLWRSGSGADWEQMKRLRDSGNRLQLEHSN